MSFLGYKLKSGITCDIISGEDKLDPSAERCSGQWLFDRDVPAQPTRRRRAGPAGVHEPLAAHHLGSRSAQLAQRGLIPPPLHQGNLFISYILQHVPSLIITTLGLGFLNQTNSSGVVVRAGRQIHRVRTATAVELSYA